MPNVIRKMAFAQARMGGPSRGAFVEALGAAVLSSRVMGWYVKYNKLYRGKQRWCGVDVDAISPPKAYGF